MHGFLVSLRKQHKSANIINTMDKNTIEMVDQVVEGYNKVKSLFQENKVMIRNIKKWVKDHKVIIFVVLIVLVAVGYFIYRQYFLNKQDVISELDAVENPEVS